MQIKRITRAQKKIIIISLISTLVFFVCLLFIYFPSRNTVKRIQIELSDVEKQIKDIESALGKAKTLDEGIKLLEVRYKSLNSRFPKGEEHSIERLSEIAQKLKIELISIKPLPKRLLTDREEKEIKLQARACYVIYVSVTMKCFYPELVKYVQAIEEELPAFATIERVNIFKNTLEKGGMLSITLDFNLYFLP